MAMIDFWPLNEIAFSMNSYPPILKLPARYLDTRDKELNELVAS